jgi:hypothetical protein
VLIGDVDQICSSLLHILKLTDFLVRAALPIHTDDSVCQYIGALLLRLTCSPRIAYCKSNRLLILPDWAETEICFLKESGIFKRKKNLDRHDLGLISKYSQIATHLISHYPQLPVLLGIFAFSL